MLSPDTNIFYSAFLADEEDERDKYTFIIFNEFTQSSSVLVNSVKYEFNVRILDSLQNLVEQFIENIEKGDNITLAIQKLPETNRINKWKLKTDQKITGIDISNIDADLKKRNEFMTNFNIKIADIKNDFSLWGVKYFRKDLIKKDDALKFLKLLDNDFKQVNSSLDNDRVHWPDTEHWIRTALSDKNESKFVTTDYFGLKKINGHLELSKRIELIINSKLSACFSFFFK